MLTNYLKTAFRNICKNKLQSLVNLLSLCIGITCVMLIYAYVKHELSYDQFFENADHIYRMEFTSGLPGKEKTRYANINKNTNPGSLESIPSVEKQTRFAILSDIFAEASNKRITETNFWASDSSFFSFFDFPLIEGNRNSVLEPSNSIVLTKKTARKYFGNQKALGKSFSVIFQDTSVPLTVTGVTKVPANTHLQFDAIASKDVYHKLYNYYVKDAYSAYNYLQLKKGANVTEVEKQLEQLNKKSGYIRLDYHLRSLTDIHLYSAVRGEISPNSDIRYIYFLSAIALILLIIGGINFTSLATAQTLQRYKEAGIRKVLGAKKRQLIGQFLVEAILLALIAVSAEYIIIYYTLPFFNTLAGSQFVFADFFNPSFILLFTGAAVVIGILVGTYPALMLSAFQPVKTLKGLAPSGKKGTSIWKSIVAIQFAASIAMIICTVAIFQQLQYIQNKNLGFDKDRIITIPNRFGKQVAPMKSQLSAIPGIESVSISSYVPGVSKTSGTGLVEIPGQSDSLTFNWISVDYNYFDTYGIKLKEGRTFSRKYGTDSTQAFMLNEAAVKALGWKSPLGKELNSIGGKRKVIGVTENFNFLSLYQNYTPIIYLVEPSLYFNFSIKIAASGDISDTIAKIENAWKTLLPNTPFNYKFVDEQFDALYKADQQMGKIFALFAGLALFITCLGLFSLSSFMAAKKKKEIGIRKVHGASISDILLYFYINYGKLVGLAGLIAVPASFYFLSKWLQNFAFKTEISVGIFILAIAMTLAIAIATVSYESIKAAFANPAESLRSE